MNKETDAHNAVDNGQFPPLPSQDSTQTDAIQTTPAPAAESAQKDNTTAQPVDQETPIAEDESELPFPSDSAPTEDLSLLQPPQPPSPETAGGPVPQPFVLRRRQHYFTNLPNIGLDAQPLRAPWEEAPSAEELSEDDYDYPNGYKPAATGKAAMTVAVTVASVLAAAVIAFIIYLVVAKGDQFTALVSPPGAATADSVAQTTIVTEPPTDAPTDISVIMPDLDGLKEDEAYKLLNQSEVRYKVHRVFSVDVPSGYIVSQYPQPFSSFMRGSQEAIIYISKGKADEIHTTPTRPKTTKPKESTAPSTTNSATSEYLLPDSASRRLTKSDISGFNRETLNLALNEIYARHGRKFSDPTINTYFESKSWYHPTIAAKDFDDSILNQFETYNVKLITNYQSEMGYR